MSQDGVAPASVHIPLLLPHTYTPADGVIIEAPRVVCCVLLQRQLPKPAAYLVAALPNLDCDELTRHEWWMKGSLELSVKHSRAVISSEWVHQQ